MERFLSRKTICKVSENHFQMNFEKKAFPCMLALVDFHEGGLMTVQPLISIILSPMKNYLSVIFCSIQSWTNENRKSLFVQLCLIIAETRVAAQLVFSGAHIPPSVQRAYTWPCKWINLKINVNSIIAFRFWWTLEQSSKQIFPAGTSPRFWAATCTFSYCFLCSSVKEYCKSVVYSLCRKHWIEQIRKKRANPTAS